MLALVGPGLLVAATGVGAGDLATAGLAGARLGTAVLWAVVIGAVMKYVLTEGLARWQLATGTTLIEGVGDRIGRWALWLFLLYMLPWTWIVCAALMSAAGAATQALAPLPYEQTTARVIWAFAASVLCLMLAWRGGFRVFERVMACCIVLMVVAVVIAAVQVDVLWIKAARGLVVPAVPDVEGAPAWTLALIGGVGGTVTMLCYGYWIRQQGRRGDTQMSLCRADLATGYLVTALFGVAMVVIASGLGPQDGSGVGLILGITSAITGHAGSAAGTIFLVGAWAAIVSSMLGVWQSVPMIVADAVRGARGAPPVDIDSLERSRTARVVLVAMATVPLVQVVAPFDLVQLIYTTIGAFFLPMLAITLIVLLRSPRCASLRLGPGGGVALLAVLVFFVWMLVRRFA